MPSAFEASLTHISLIIFIRCFIVKFQTSLIFRFCPTPPQYHRSDSHFPSLFSLILFALEKKNYALYIFDKDKHLSDGRPSSTQLTITSCKNEWKTDISEDKALPSLLFSTLHEYFFPIFLFFIRSSFISAQQSSPHSLSVSWVPLVEVDGIHSSSTAVNSNEKTWFVKGHHETDSCLHH